MNLPDQLLKLPSIREIALQDFLVSVSPITSMEDLLEKKRLCRKLESSVGHITLTRASSLLVSAPHFLSEDDDDYI